VRFRGRGCAICIASASMMTEVFSGMNRSQALGLAQRVKDWLGQDGGEQPPGLPQLLRSLEVVRAYPVRRRCLSLAWEALLEALTAAPAGDGKAIT